MPKVFIFAATGDSYKVLEANGCEVALGKREWHHPNGGYEHEVVATAQGADAMAGTSMRTTPISRKVLEASPNLRVVSKSTVGVDDIDVDAATEMGILVTHAPVESNWGNIAEVTVTFTLALLKGLLEQDSTIKEGGWYTEGRQGTYIGTRQSDGYKGITLGIIGLGRIGMRVAHLLRPWNITILGYDPYVPDYRFLEAGVIPTDFETLLKESDVVTMHVVLTKETRHMMGTKEFAIMKRGAYFINTSRGECHDEAALCDAVERGLIAGCGLNAFEVEPVAPDSPLRRLGDRVLLRPHGGTPPAGVNTVGRSAGQATEWVNTDVLRALKGEVPIHVYNKDAVPRWLERFGGKSLL